MFNLAYCISFFLGNIGLVYLSFVLKGMMNADVWLVIPQYKNMNQKQRLVVYVNPC